MVEYRGELVADAADLAAQSVGRLLEVYKNLGDEVVAGEVLARVDASEGRRLYAEALAQAEAMQATKRRAEAQLALAQAEADRAGRLLAEGIMSEQEALTQRSAVEVLAAEIKTIEAQQAAARARAALFRNQVAESRIVAPFGGAVAERYLDPGATVQPGTQVLRIVASGALRVRFRIPEKDLARVQLGSAFTLTTQATASRRFRGTVERLSAEVSRADRSVAAEGVLSDTSAALRPGMYATLTLYVETLRAQTLIPTAALATRIADDGEQRQRVRVIDDEGRVRALDVQVLGSAGNEAAVTGISVGDRVVTLGHEGLSDGARVRVVE